MNPSRRPRIDLRHAAWLLTLMLAATAARSEAPAVEPYEKDVNFLASKVAQYRYRLKSSSDGSTRLSTLETGVAEMKSIVPQLKEHAEEIEAKDSKVQYLKTMELGPKERELDRVRRDVQLWTEEIGRDEDALNQAIAVHNGGKKLYTLPDEQAGLDAYNAEKAMLEGRQSALNARRDKRKAELKEQFTAAFVAYTKAQQELSETETKRAQAAQEFQTQAGQYATARGPVVAELEALDNEPTPTVSVPLTPFSQGVPPGEAGTIPIVPAPVGPGNNTHAIDQLQVITSSDRFAAGRDEHDQPVNSPPPAVAKHASSYGFDDGKGIGKADLPEVGTPEGKPVDAVPLTVPPAPAAQENAPPAVKASPTLEKFAQKRTEGFTKLDQLYQQRRELMQQGPQASPEAWTQVVKDISSTQAAVNMAGVGLKLAEGSQLMDLSIVPKSQHKISDLNLPPHILLVIPKPYSNVRDAL